MVANGLRVIWLMAIACQTAHPAERWAPGGVRSGRAPGALEQVDLLLLAHDHVLQAVLERL